MSKTDAEIARPGMPSEERIARMIARGLGHNDENGMHWEKYILGARCILKNCRVMFPK